MRLSHSSSVMNFLKRNARGSQESSTTSPLHLSCTCRQHMKSPNIMNSCISQPKWDCNSCHTAQHLTLPCSPKASSTESGCPGWLVLSCGSSPFQPGNLSASSIYFSAASPRCRRKGASTIHPHALDTMLTPTQQSARNFSASKRGTELLHVWQLA